MEQISEAFNKCFVADFIFSVSRTIDDKKANTGKIYIAKNRNGPDGIVYDIFMDTSNVSIKILPKVPDGQATQGTPVLDPAAQKELLKSRYDKFRIRKGVPRT